MLEVRGVTKIYKTKGGAETKALDGVTLSFGETGLVFLLGKSGSGKSTLLNVCGGLDEPTSGEVIVKGKSSKNFSGSDFDSYRNTFVGFIFQEYNVLDEFNVEDNVALALELQGKAKDKDEIAAILREVGLEELSKRKPNTLSGGQKQRIAIARALVKKPQIIMADEPTGALDSVTGRQLFDTLKKLSETRLVLVVSHDREFAEIYGDRIIELKDGRVVSDVTKTDIPPEELDENLKVTGGSTLSIKSGGSLTKENFEAIKSFIAQSETDVIITRGEKQIAAFKKANRMTDDGTTETFEDTIAQNAAVREYTAEESSFIRSRLPALKALKIGASSLKLKPIRLIFTILLSFIAFTMFGLFSTLMVYNGKRVAVNSFMSSDYSYLNVTKSVVHHADIPHPDGKTTFTYYTTPQTKFTQTEVDKFRRDYGSGTFGYFVLGNGDSVIANVDVHRDKMQYYLNSVKRYAYLNPSNFLRSGLRGRYPERYDEICISSYLAELMLSTNSDFHTVTSDFGSPSYGSGSVHIASVNDLIGKTVAIQCTHATLAFTISGIFSSGSVPSEYNELKEATQSGFDLNLAAELNTLLSEGIHQLVLVAENFYSAYEPYMPRAGYFTDRCASSLSGSYYGYRDDDRSDWGDTPDYLRTVEFSNELSAYKPDNVLKSYFFGGENKTELYDDEMIAGIDILTEDIYLHGVREYFKGKIEAGDYDGDVRLNLPINVFADELTEEFRVKLAKYSWENSTNIMTREYRDELFGEILEVAMRLKPMDVRLSIDGKPPMNFKIVGFHEPERYVNNSFSLNSPYFTENFMKNNLVFAGGNNTFNYVTNYEFTYEEIYGGICVAYDGGERVIAGLYDSVGAENRTENDVQYNLECSLYNSVQTVNGMAKQLSTVFLVVGLIFAVFSALLMFNFISVSISNKRKEIGILRAVGARGTDVFKIFFAESGIITGICTALALIGTFLACGYLNSTLKAELHLNVTLFVFGIASVGMMIGIALAVAFISTFLPVYFAARKKPVDSIRAL